MTSAPSPTAAIVDSSPSLAELARLCRSSSTAAASDGVWSQSLAFEWAAALDSVLAVHGAQAEWSALLSADDKQAILQYAASALPQQSSGQEGVEEVLRQWLCVLKTVSRSRSQLDTLYDAKFAAWLCECVARPVERHSRESTIALEAARLLLNLAIINTDTMHEEQHSLDVAFLVARVLVFMCINPHLRLLFEQERLLSILVSAVLSHTASPAALASTRASSPASTPVVSPRQSGGVQSAALQRQLVAELVKLLCHLCMDDQGHALQQAVTNDTFHEFGERIVALLSLNVTIPQQTALLLARPTLSNTDATETQLDDIHVDESPSAAITAAADTATALAPTSAASTPSSATSPSSPSRQQRDQTRLALQDMREEAEEAAASEQPQSVSVRQLKREIADCLIYLPAHLASFLEDDIKAVQALVLILHRNLLTAREDAKSEENVLTPIVSSLTGLAVESRNIRRYIKTAIFQEAALLSPSTESTPAAVMSMVPAGSVNEQQLDVDPLSLRSLLLPYCTSIKFRVKAAVSELLFQLCDAQANDFIRLCGLGNAIGLLAEKGLPGFTGLTQQALSLDALMAAKKSSGS